MKFPSSIQCMDYHIFEKKKKRKHKLIQDKNLFVGTEIIVNVANEYDCDMYNMCNQMYNQMYLTTWHYCTC